MESDKPGHPGEPINQQNIPRKKSKLKWLLLLLIPAGIILLILGILGLGALYELSGKSVEVTGTDREVVIDIERLAEWIEDFVPDKGKETIKKKRYFDGSIEIEYEYDDPDNDTTPYLNCTVSMERRLEDARIAYLTLWGGTKIGLAIGGNTDSSVEEKNDLFSWGDESRFGILKHKGMPYGNVFIARKGKRTFYLLFAGVYFDNPEYISELLLPSLAKLETYE